MAPLPRTLLQIAGAPHHSGRLSTSALLLIDHQREYLDGALPLAGIAAAVDAAGVLLRRARAAGAPVLHVLHVARPGAPLFAAGGSGAAVIPSLAPAYGEPTVVKSLPNAFAGTDLLDRLRGIGRSDLVVAGFATHMCVGATVRAALDLGFRCTVVADATATRDLPDPLGGVVPAATVQRAALAALADRFATVVPDAAAVA
ncbi:cysteine hydrolase family protein [Azospirillum sp. A39]|uniref:cysteine hydrolase family protein n=1 Tax=Azospirillum sp. A39 TaxID=3462279 RepID=UPI0040464A21